MKGVIASLQGAAISRDGIATASPRDDSKNETPRDDNKKSNVEHRTSNVERLYNYCLTLLYNGRSIIICSVLEQTPNNCNPSFFIKSNGGSLSRIQFNVRCSTFKVNI